MTDYEKAMLRLRAFEISSKIGKDYTFEQIEAKATYLLKWALGNKSESR